MNVHGWVDAKMEKYIYLDGKAIAGYLLGDGISEY